jgi:hypothetical protein
MFILQEVDVHHQYIISFFWSLGVWDVKHSEILMEVWSRNGDREDYGRKQYVGMLQVTGKPQNLDDSLGWDVCSFVTQIMQMLTFNISASREDSAVPRAPGDPSSWVYIVFWYGHPICSNHQFSEKFPHSEAAVVRGYVYKTIFNIICKFDAVPC